MEDSGFLAGVRVLEVANEVGEYCGRRLATLGAEVIKVEPPGGEETRRYGPFTTGEDGSSHSLYFWHYNFGKKSVVLDLETAAGRSEFRRLAGTSDVLLDARPTGCLDALGLGYVDLRTDNPGLVYLRMSPYGDEGPWATFRGSDLVHLALGGVMMNCGYDPEPGGGYDLPPVAPQMWQAYHIAGEMGVLSAIAALTHRLISGRGQHLALSVHEAVSMNTELDLPNWIYSRQAHHRQTCRHSMPTGSDPSLAMTKDGRWISPYRTYLNRDVGPSFLDTVRLLDRFGMAAGLDADSYLDPEVRALPASHRALGSAVDRLVSGFCFSRDVWREAQEEGLAWAPVRKPEENVADEHWVERGAFATTYYEELGRSLSDVLGTWRAPEVPWSAGRRAPRLGEHTTDVFSNVIKDARDPFRTVARQRRHPRGGVPRKEPWALPGVRIVDLSWLLASGGAGRYFAALGAEVIKVEHMSRLDRYRNGQGVVPEGGRRERATASGPLYPVRKSVNQSGAFMEVNAGKRSVSINLKSERGRELVLALVRDADIVIEGFSPGTMDRLGLGYERLREANSSIIYVQQSGMGQYGKFGRMRTFGPSAQAMSGLTDMSGLPEPFPPAGIGYSYLDWFGAYNMATAMMSALYRRWDTGRGCYIDASQVECGLSLTGTAILDWEANGKRWERYGNRSPYKPAAPHGAYRTAGDDRWIAIACFSDEDWHRLVGVVGGPAWAASPQFATMESRLSNQDLLDRLLTRSTSEWDGRELMESLQAAGVAAGVCQTAEDRCEVDPQLRSMNWLTELEQADIGVWPVRGFPVRFSETPARAGGPLSRHGPSYGEDNDYVLGELLGLGAEERDALAAQGVI